MKKGIAIFLVIVLVGLSYIFFKSNDTDSTTSSFHVNEKRANHNMEILGFDINSSEEMIIIIENENVWNLIQLDNTYFIVFSEDVNGMKKLESIEIMN